MGKLTRRPWKRLRKAVRALPEAPADADLHEVRKRAKQARYALEAVAPVAGPRVARAAKRLADLQGVLGDHQDTVVAYGWLHDAARDSGDAESKFVAGVMAGSFARDRRDLREQWRNVWRARRSAAPAAVDRTRASSRARRSVRCRSARSG